MGKHFLGAVGVMSIAESDRESGGRIYLIAGGRSLRFDVYIADQGWSLVVFLLLW